MYEYAPDSRSKFPQDNGLYGTSLKETTTTVISDGHENYFDESKL